MTEKIQTGQIGYIPKEFKNHKRYVKPLKVIDVDSSFLLKTYDLHTGEPSSDRVLNDFEAFLKAKAPEINRELGVGFAILSRDMVNISRWSAEYPIVIKNTLYEFNEAKGDVLDARKVDVEDLGPYCIWELGIVNHERGAWMRYLNSNRDKENLTNYIEDMLKGEWA
jgi:hypothetical protein